MRDQLTSTQKKAKKDRTTHENEIKNTKDAINKARKVIQDLQKQLSDKETNLDKQVVEKDNVIAKLKSQYTSCKKDMVKYRKKATSNQEQIDCHIKVGGMSIYSEWVRVSK